MSNIGFRKLAVVNPETGRPGLGFKPGELYTCPATGPKTEATCHDDGRAVDEDPVVGPIRKGDHTRSAVSLLQIGELTFAFLPGEVPGELVIGLPKGIKATPERWADETPAAHTPPEQITTPGYVKRMLPGTWTWAVGLGNDELGYILPLSDYRVLCVADKLGGAGACARLHQAGLIDFPDAVSGARCKALAEDPAALAALPEGAARDAVVGSCRYGQAMGRPQGHYEETNSAGWDVAADMLAAVATLTGKSDATQVNEQFAGYHHRISAAEAQSAAELRNAAMPRCRNVEAGFSTFSASGIAAFRASYRLRRDRPGLEAGGLEVLENRVHARGHRPAGSAVVLLDQAAHRERAEPDRLHVEGPDGALEMLAEVDEFGDDRSDGHGAQVGHERRGVLGGLVAGAERSRHGRMIPRRAAPKRPGQPVQAVAA